MSITVFHVAIQRWFQQTFSAATAVQEQAWTAVASGQHTLLAAPTGSGKTLAAFLGGLDLLVKEGLQNGLSDQTRVLYISPLKALSNDIQINLQQPLQGVREQLTALGLPDLAINAWVRTGDTPQSERSKAARKPPHIVVTTPESVYLLLTSESGRKMLSTVRTVIVDEIHAIAGSKRGSHLSLSLERLQGLVEQHRPGHILQRIGLSATQKPIETMARFLVGDRPDACAIIDTGHRRQWDLDLVIPESPLTAVMANEVWTELYDQLAAYAGEHRTMLVFVNTRRLAERVARFVAERIGDAAVMAHHGSMAKDKRLEAEQKLKRGELTCLVATASLELGIDIGDIDLVCQLGSPRTIAAFLQRVGRSGHRIGAIPKGRLLPLSRDELVECTALLAAAKADRLDRIIIPEQPLDVLAQQIVAEVGARDWALDDLYRVLNKAWPYRQLSLDSFETVVGMLAEGYATRRGRRAAYLHLDAVNRQLRARKQARTLALTNGGAIPDQFDCDVMLMPEGLRIGTVGEDFAFESIPGDIFQLGNNSYRTLKTETGKVYVEDAKGLPPTIPFWFGEAPGRSDELSEAVSQLRSAVQQQLKQGSAVAPWLQQHYALSAPASEQLGHYLATAQAALGRLPTRSHIVFERFFDEVGDMHLVIHSCFGSRLNKAWGLALRKRFCRKFNFELQASALEDSIVLSLSSSHSFPLEEVARYLHSNSVRELLIQALLDVPMFPTRWRWNATIALAVLRNRYGKRSPPYFQRSDAEDLVAILFPDQIACGENIAGDRMIPEHPLVQQTLDDCLHDTMDIDGLIRLLQGIEQGDISVSCCDLTSPSPLAQEIINARPYAFLDDGAAEERRTMAVKSQNFIQLADAARLRQPDRAAIDKVRQEAWPSVNDAEELHDALMVLGFITEQEAHRGNRTDALGLGWQIYFEQLAETARACKMRLANDIVLWLAAERLADFKQLFADAVIEPKIPALATGHRADQCLTEIVRSRLEGIGPVTVAELAAPLALAPVTIEPELRRLEQEGFVIQGHFSAENGPVEWCERRLLARIHRYTVKRLRAEIEPVGSADMMRFLLDWQHLSEPVEGVEALAAVLQQLEAYSISAQVWLSDILPSRVSLFSSAQLETLSLSGRISWLRLNVAETGSHRKSGPVRHSPIAIIQRNHLTQWQRLSNKPEQQEAKLSGSAEKIVKALADQGALFFMDLVDQTGLLKTQVEEALGELVNWGKVTSDSYAGLQALTTPAAKRPRIRSRRGGRVTLSAFDNAGRWSLIRRPSEAYQDDDVQLVAEVLLQRYGVVFKKILQRETRLPPWRELLAVYWRMEARGEIRGGRFVAGVSGEQFALPEALAALQKIRNTAPTGALLTLSSADPLNLTGSLLPSARVPVSAQTKIIIRDGVAVAVYENNDLHFLQELDNSITDQINRFINAGKLKTVSQFKGAYG